MERQHTLRIEAPWLLGLFAGAALVLLAGASSALVARADTATSTPIISGIMSSTTDTGATVRWTTDVATNAQIQYGTTTSYGTFSALDTATSTSHSLTLSALTPGTTYHFQIQSSDASGTLATSSDQTLTTTSQNATSTASSTLNVMVMVHLCNSGIHNLTDFDNVGNGKSPIAALAADVLACPTTGLPANAAVANTVAAPRSTYDFSVQSGTTTQTVATNGVFMPTKLCESDVNIDVNSDGTIASSTCLDISHYQLSMASTSGNTVVMETAPPPGYHFGTLLFTPPALDGNNDSQNLVSLDSSNGTITLNTQHDADGMVMLHLYQFLDSTSTPTTTPAAVISGITSSTTDTGATINWTTDVGATSQILYGTNAFYGASTTLATAFTTSHSQTLNGLTPGTTYHFQIQGTNASGTLATSTDRTFATLASTPTTTPGTGTGGTGTTTTQDLQSQIDQLRGLITTLQQQFNALQQQVTSLQQQLGSGTGGTGSTGTTTTNTGSATGATANAISSISANGVIDLGGRNFAPNESVAITLNGSLVATGHADGGGNFTTGSLRGPASAGTYTYTFTGQQSGAVRTATLTVTP